MHYRSAIAHSGRICIGSGTTSEYDFRAGMILTDWAEQHREEFNREYADGGCTCFISPPCGYCTHEGNPRNQEEDPDCWVSIIQTT